MPALHEEIFVLFIIIRYTIKRFDAFKGKIIQKDEGTAGRLSHAADCGSCIAAI